MAIPEDEIRILEDLFETCRGLFSARRHEKEVAISYLNSRPHLLFPLGYDEARIFSSSNEEAHKDVAAVLEQVKGDRPAFKGSITNEAILRDRATGQWHMLYYIWGEDALNPNPLSINFKTPTGQDLEITIEEYLSRLRNTPIQPTDRMVLQDLWVPPAFPRSAIRAYAITQSLTRAIQDGHLSLAKLNWRQLEELVAELLKSEGLDVTVTPQTRDGGRDIVASGELFPGLRTSIAVEVTKQGTVGIEKLSQALYRNRHFPLVMVATSGRFSSGVIREQSGEENRMRVLLRDGDALNDWIKRSMR